jgi:hypothetical protein
MADEPDPDLLRQSEVLGTWLRALAGDADAAIAAALAYEAFGPEERDGWLAAVAMDMETQGIEPLAVYAPLLGVEEDPARRGRIVDAIRAGGGFSSTADPRALGGIRADGTRVYVLVAPLWLDFVEVLAAACDDNGFGDFVHVPLAHARDPLPELGATLTPTVPDDAVEELALALLANDRSGRARPRGVGALTRFLTPRIGHGRAA